MTMYQLVADNILGVDKTNSYLYVITVKLPKYFEFSSRFEFNETGFLDKALATKSLDIKYHEDKFTRLKLNLGLSTDMEAGQLKSFTVNLLFHPELMKIQRYVLHHGNHFECNTTPQDTDVSLDTLEDRFDQFQLINTFVGSHLEKIGVRNQ